MGRVGTFKQLKNVTVDGEIADEATVDFGAADVATALHFSPAGVLSKPKNDDIAVVVELDGSDEYAVVGYIDVTFINPASDGEVYLYARDADGVKIAHIHMKIDGAVEIVNSKGNFKLDKEGIFSANGHLTVSV